jgi:hypothetical protein
MLSDGMDKMSFSKHLEIQVAWHAGLSLQNNLFYSLKTLKLDNCGIEQYAIPSNILPCLMSLKDLQVRNCDKVKVIFGMNDTGVTETALQLKYLTLEGLPELTLVWEKNFNGILSFQNLQEVSVRDCKRMQTLFPAALAKNLKTLEKLKIKSCKELREIVGKEVDAATDVTKTILFRPINWAQLVNELPLGRILQENPCSITREEQLLVRHHLPHSQTPDFQVPLLLGTRGLTPTKNKMILFPRLTSLTLEWLPEVTFFYPETFSMESPKLKNLCVLGCPKLELFKGAHPDSDGEGESSSSSIKRQHLFLGLKVCNIESSLSIV